MNVISDRRLAPSRGGVLSGDESGTLLGARGAGLVAETE